MNHLMFDFAIAAILLVFVWLGRRRGFVLTLCGLLAMFVALIGASVLSELLSAPVARLVEPAIESSVTQILQQSIDPSQWQITLPDLSAGGEGSTLPQLPLEQAMAALEGTQLYRMFGQSLQAAVNEGTVKLVSSAAAAIAAYMARELTRLVLFLISFVVVLLAWNLLARVLDLAFRLPVLSSINRLLGSAVGLVKGALVVYIAVWLLRGSLSPELVEQTVLLKFFCENSPLSLLNMI